MEIRGHQPKGIVISTKVLLNHISHTNIKNIVLGDWNIRYQLDEKEDTIRYIYDKSLLTLERIMEGLSQTSNWYFISKIGIYFIALKFPTFVIAKKKVNNIIKHTEKLPSSINISIL